MDADDLVLLAWRNQLYDAIVKGTSSRRKTYETVDYGHGVVFPDYSDMIGIYQVLNHADEYLRKVGLGDQLKTADGLP